MKIGSGEERRCVYHQRFAIVLTRCANTKHTIRADVNFLTTYFAIKRAESKA